MPGWRRIASFFLAALVAAGILVAAPHAGAGEDSESSPDPRPNIVVIMTDDQAVESIRVMDNVAQDLAGRGVTFKRNLASYPLCCPSRITFLTGQHAHNHGVLSNTGPQGGYSAFAGRETTFPVALQNAGYRTSHVGKYANGYGRPDPREIPPGWTKWVAFPGTNAYRYWDYKLNVNGNIKKYGTDEADYQTDVLRRFARRRIENDAPRNEPFFLSIAPVAPHLGKNPAFPGGDLAWPAPRHSGAFASEPLPMPPSFNEDDVSDKPNFIQNSSQLSDSKIEEMTAQYRARLESLLAVDSLVRGVVRALKDAGELDDSVILFTSDNGFFQGEHREPAGKRLHYEPSTRVPLIVRGEGVANGATTKALVSNIDLAPTILELADASPLTLPDGRSLIPLLASPGAPWPDDVLLEAGPPGARKSYQAIRTTQYKYVEWWTGETELYDLDADPHELRNRSGKEQFAEIEADLAMRLAALKTCAGPACQL
ncbi:MAG: sulfatase family protein [Acidimicrobiia bacterium]